jgi:hypothetical protein
VGLAASVETLGSNLGAAAADAATEAAVVPTERP